MEKMERGTVRVAADKGALFESAAELIANSARAAIARSGRFALVLTGGSTPKGLYELLASDEWRDRIVWNKTYFFWGDERFVPATDSQSNYAMAKVALLDHLNLPAANIRRIVTENTTPEVCANKYAADIQRFFQAPPGTFPAFDFILNGMGSNRHTLSLFPGRPTLHEKSRMVVADYIPEVSMNRITMTAPLVNAGKTVVFLLSGKDKAEALNDVLYGAVDVDRKPAQAIRPTNGELVWLVDRDAASELPHP
jgi:6-phosphogluconolactonase